MLTSCINEHAGAVAVLVLLRACIAQGKPFILFSVGKIQFGIFNCVLGKVAIELTDELLGVDVTHGVI